MESREAANPSKEPRKAFRFRPYIAIILVPALAVAVFWIWRYGSVVVRRAQYAARTPTFSDSSERLTQTAIVPTLASPLSPGRNIIWCSSFQLAWNELRDKVIGAPLEVVGAQEIADRLNAAKASLSDLDAKSVYAAGGRVGKGIRETIRKDMAAKFPQHAPPDFSDYTDGLLAYSYLTARVPFKYPFRQVDKGITFTDSQGVQSQVAGFGLWEAYQRRYEKIREQVEILYIGPLVNDYSRNTEYALDLCRDSEPYQVVAARVEPRGTLAETLDYVRTRIADFRNCGTYKRDSRFSSADELKVPEMFWRIDHRFTELVGKTIANSNPPTPIAEAFQTIEFRLDRSGAILESESILAAKSESRYFEFNRPFLVYMQKRGAERPFFVMWVDNAELLVHE
ncbi:MAG: hypothetical protein ACM3VT_02625 [Solirubrobacterales bacterium]